MKIFYSQESKPIGELSEGIFRKLVHTENIFHKHEAWGIDKDVWDSLPEGTELRFKDVDTGEIYIVDYETARSTKITDHIPPYEMQVFIPLTAFTKK